MVKSIIKGVAEELGELGKKTGETVVEQAKESGKDFVKAFIGMADVASVSPEEYARKEQKQLEKDQKNLAFIRKNLKEQAIIPQEKPPSVFEQKKQEEIFRKQRQAELVKQKQQQQLPAAKPKQKRGSLFAFKKRKEAHVEMGKSTGE